MVWKHFGLSLIIDVMLRLDKHTAHASTNNITCSVRNSNSKTHNVTLGAQKQAGSYVKDNY